jgi:membrane fusion protein (multidrug efflux system)
MQMQLFGMQKVCGATAPAVAMAFGLCFALCGCSKKSDAGAAGGFAVPVVAAEARLEPVSESLSLVGSIVANEQVEIKSETEGTVQDINFNEGQPVNKGDLLIRLDETKFSTALAEAESTFQLAKANFERAGHLAQDRTISRQEYDQAASAVNVSEAAMKRRERELKDARIYAPFSGIVGARYVSPGQVIDKNTRLTVLVDLNPVKVEMNVPERFLNQVRTGQQIEISVAAFQSKKFSGKVYFVSPELESTTRTAMVKAEIPNPDAELKPGMFANLDLTVKVRDQAVVIPEAAIMLQQTNASVFVVGPDNSVQFRPVRLGFRMPGRVEVLDGVRGGENVIVEGVQKVGPGAKVMMTVFTNAPGA